MKKLDDVEIMLQNIIRVSPSSYPGRIYGMYEWSEVKNKWDISRDWLISQRISKLEFILSRI